MRRQLLVLGLLALMPAGGVYAARVDLESFARGLDTVPIAVVPFAFSGSAPPLGDEPWRVIAEDLAFSPRFKVVKPTRPDSAYFAQSGIGLYIDGVCSMVGDQVTIDCYLRDAAKGEQLLARKYRGEVKFLRSMSHRFSNEIVQILLGDKGIFESRILFVRQEGQAKNLFVVDYDGHNTRRLTNTKTLNIFPCFADSSTAIWTSFQRGKPDIYRGSITGGEPKIFIYGRHLSTSPAVSPIDGRIAYASSKPGNLEIFVCDPDGSNVRQLTFIKGGIDTSPCWSPNGYQIAFTSDRSGGPQIYVMDADGSNVRRLTYQGSYQDSPAWSPRGDRIAYSSMQDGVFGVWSIAPDGSDARRVTSTPGASVYPSWSPDGLHIVFSSGSGGRSDLYTVRLDGSDLRRVTETGDAGMPDWGHF